LASHRHLTRNRRQNARRPCMNRDLWHHGQIRPTCSVRLGHDHTSHLGAASATAFDIGHMRACLRTTAHTFARGIPRRHAGQPRTRGHHLPARCRCRDNGWRRHDGQGPLGRWLGDDPDRRRRRGRGLGGCDAALLHRHRLRARRRCSGCDTRGGLCHRAGRRGPRRLCGRRSWRCLNTGCLGRGGRSGGGLGGGGLGGGVSRPAQSRKAGLKPADQLARACHARHPGGRTTHTGPDEHATVAVDILASGKGCRRYFCGNGVG